MTSMEQVLDVYKRPYDPGNPVVCIDEMPKQLIQEARVPFTDSKGVAHYDSEYIRSRTTNVFMGVEPLAGKRMARIVGTKRRYDFARYRGRGRRQLPGGAHRHNRMRQPCDARRRLLL